MTWSGVTARDFMSSEEAALLEERAKAKKAGGTPLATGHAKVQPPTLRAPRTPRTTGSATCGQVERVKLADIDTTVVVRAIRIDPQHLAEMVAARRRGVEFPPVVLFRDPATRRLHLPDGQHRCEMYLEGGETEVDAVIYSGGKREAFLHALQLGRDLPRTTKDKQHCLEALLRDPEWANWTNPVLADMAGVDEKTVQAARRRLGLTPAPRTARDGRTYQPRKPARTVSNPEIPHCSSTTTEPMAVPRASNPGIPCPAANSEPSAPPLTPIGNAHKSEATERSASSAAFMATEPPDFVMSLATGGGTTIKIRMGSQSLEWDMAEKAQVVIHGRMPAEPGEFTMEIVGAEDPNVDAPRTGSVSRPAPQSDVPVATRHRHGDVTATSSDGANVMAAIRKLRGQ